MRRIIKGIIVGFMFFIFGNIHAQDEGIRLNTPQALDGFTLFEATEDTYLINNCGEVVNIWPGRNSSDLHPKLLPNGNLLYIDIENSFNQFNNSIVEVDWNNNIVRKTSHNKSNLMLNYEVIVLENGNYLCLARRELISEYFYSQGYNPALGVPTYDDTVVEIVPETGQIVWEWNISDHVIQERNNSLPNYGSVSDNPQLLNVDAISNFDWSFEESFMINGMDYNFELDQIVLSVRKISEIIIIDHSTSTEEANGSTGGNSGKGGDILYRFGNPQNYGQGEAENRTLYYQHNPNWIKYGNHKGKIIIHNNGLDRPGTSFNNRYSSAEIIEPVVDNNGQYVLAGDKAFLPLVPDLSFNRITTNTNFYSGYTSGAVVLPNGNIFITEGAKDRYFEVDESGSIVWEYINHLRTYVFRSEKYPKDYPAFSNVDLTPSGTVENYVSNYNCSIITTSNLENDIDNTLAIYYNGFQLECWNSTRRKLEIQIYNSTGQLFTQYSFNSEKEFFNTDLFISGVYHVLILSEEQEVIITKSIFIK